MTNLDWIVLGTLIGAVALVSICALVNGVPSRIRLGKRVGPVNFDFSKSFASTITALGALLATVLASKGVVVISHPHLDSVSYAALSLFFGLLVVIAHSRTGLSAALRMSRMTKESQTSNPKDMPGVSCFQQS